MTTLHKPHLVLKHSKMFVLSPLRSSTSLSSNSFFLVDCGGYYSCRNAYFVVDQETQSIASKIDDIN